MRIDVDIALLQDCADRHWDFMREYRLTGDVKYLKGFVMDVIEYATKEEPSEDIIRKFKQNITNREFNALYSIIEEIGEEGNISVVKMIQKTGHSRPVFTSLLSKMETYKIAEVQNQGVKGTHIKLLYSKEEILSNEP